MILIAPIFCWPMAKLVTEKVLLDRGLSLLVSI